jgi:hypothetical protein
MMIFNSRADVDQWVDDQGYWTVGGVENGSDDPMEIEAQAKLVAYISDSAHRAGLRYGDDWDEHMDTFNYDELMGIANNT